MAQVNTLYGQSYTVLKLDYTNREHRWNSDNNKTPCCASMFLDCMNQKYWNMGFFLGDTKIEKADKGDTYFDNFSKQMC